MVSENFGNGLTPPIEPPCQLARMPACLLEGSAARVGSGPRHDISVSALHRYFLSANAVGPYPKSRLTKCTSVRVFSYTLLNYGGPSVWPPVSSLLIVYIGINDERLLVICVIIT